MPARVWHLSVPSFPFLSMALLVLRLIPSIHRRRRAPQSRFADVHGVKLHSPRLAGKGDPVGAAARLCRNQPYVAAADRQLADKHAVIAPELRGFGQSSSPEDATPRKRCRRTSTRW